MRRIKLFVILLLFWFLLYLKFDLETLLIGIFVSGFVTIISYKVLFDDRTLGRLPISLKNMVVYLFALIIEIYQSGFIYIKNVLFLEYEPVVFTVILDIKDPVVLSIVANSITLTPGTISIEVDPKYSMITVMTLAKKNTPLRELEQPIHDKVNRLVKRRGLDDHK